MNALLAAGHSRSGPALEARVIRDIARMLGGWVLLHYDRGTYHTLRPQTEHTLSTWTIHKLTRTRRVTRRRVRPRPEFWRPEQQRPGGILAFPIGGGVACIARRRPFEAGEARTVRGVLQFLGDRTRPAIGAGRAPLPRSTQRLAGEGLIGRSPRWQRVLVRAQRAARSRCSVVLLGASGTGKERLARALHASSLRSQGPFVAINCGAIPGDLLASELFGHIRGSFSGAHRNRVGLIERAHRGTLFLDEVADMPARMQVAMLRVLEERALLPVGSTRPRKVDVRVISATHQDLKAAVATGRFREDLYHRLDVLTIELPPLAQRGDDVLLIAEHLVATASPPRRLHPDAAAVLRGYSWPGNVRELDNVLTAASLLLDDEEITPAILEQVLSTRHPGRQPPPPRPRALGPRASRILGLLSDRWLSAPELAQKLDVSPRTINRELQQLVASGLVTFHGEARARAYRRQPR